MEVIHEDNSKETTEQREQEALQTEAQRMKQAREALTRERTERQRQAALLKEQTALLKAKEKVAKAEKAKKEKKPKPQKTEREQRQLLASELARSGRGGYCPSPKKGKGKEKSMKR